MREVGGGGGEGGRRGREGRIEDTRDRVDIVNGRERPRDSENKTADTIKSPSEFVAVTCHSVTSTPYRPVATLSHFSFG